MHKPLTGAVAVLLVVPCVAIAAFEHIEHVFQPIEVEGPGLVVAMVSYVGYGIDWQSPASAILLTTEPNAVLCDGTPKNRNAAAMRGVRFLDETLPPDSAIPGMGRWSADTLHIRVDVSSLVIPPDKPRVHNVYRESYRELLSATLWCGLRNARMNWPRVRFVDYRIEGPEVFTQYAGVYALAEVESIGPPLDAVSAALRPPGTPR